MKPRQPLRSQRMFEALNGSKDKTWIGLINEGGIYQFVSRDQLSLDDSNPDSPIDFKRYLAQYTYFKPNETTAFSVKYSDKENKWMASFIFPEESGMADIPRDARSLAQKIVSISFDLLTFNEESIAWAEIVRAQFKRYSLVQFSPNQTIFFESDIYINEEKDQIKCCAYDSVSSSFVTHSILLDELPNDFPRPLELKSPHSLNAILTAINKRPEQELKELFDRAEEKVGEEFTIERRNQLFEKFDKSLLIHKGWFQYGIINTGSYRKVAKEIREKALEKLRTDIKSIKDRYLNMDSHKIHELNNKMINAMLMKAREMPIFKDHRNNFIFTGAWGRTTAVWEIDQLLKQYPIQEAYSFHGEEKIRVIR